MLTTVFASLTGRLLAAPLPHYRLEIDVPLEWLAGNAIAAVVSLGALGLGAHHLMRQSRFSPAVLLRGAGT